MKKREQYGIWVAKTQGWVEEGRRPVIYPSRKQAERDLRDFAVDLKGYEVRRYRRVS